MAEALLPLIARLLDPAAYPHPTADIRLIETHISWVFLTGEFVYKVKKPCNLGFLDYSTLENRQRCCAEEVRLSGRFAPELYLGVVPITGPPNAAIVGGPGTPIEWAVKVRQFDEDSQLDRLFDDQKLTAADCEQLGADIALLQRQLETVDRQAGSGSPDTFAATVALNISQLRAACPDVGPHADAVQAWIVTEVARLRDVIEARVAAGKVRHCHGDLHLANIVRHRGRMVAFDAIEFNESLRCIDVANDMAFLAMDLYARGRSDFAARLVNAWIESADDHSAAAVLPLFMVYRAVVRAAVAAIRHQQAITHGDAAAAAAARTESNRYLAVAVDLTVARRPTMFVTTGVSGTGKTTLAARIVDATGAVRLRSDVERKRLASMSAIERPDDEYARVLYGEAMTETVYRRLATLATTILQAGTNVVVDATCNTREQRDLLATVAHDLDVPLRWLELDVPAEFVLARVAARQAAGTDASDASVDVVRSQLAKRQPILPEELVAWPRAHLVRVTPWDAEDPTFIRRLTTS